MADDPGDRPSEGEPSLARTVGAKAARKLKAQRDGTRNVWFGLGMSGLIGWSVTVPTVLGALFGHWLDRRHPGPYSWTLTFLIIGLAVGSANAWHWVAREDEAMHDRPEDDDA